MMKSRMIAKAFMAMLIVGSAQAGPEEVAACAEDLSDPAQLVFQSVVPRLTPGIDGRKVMRSTVIELVKSGEIKRSEARSSAQAAGECLMKYQD